MTIPGLSGEGVDALCFRQTIADMLTRRKLYSIGINSDSSIQSPLVFEGSLYFFLRFSILKPLIYGLGSRSSSICASTCRAGFSDLYITIVQRSRFAILIDCHRLGPSAQPSRQYAFTWWEEIIDLLPDKVDVLWLKSRHDCEPCNWPVWRKKALIWARPQRLLAPHGETHRKPF